MLQSRFHQFLRFLFRINNFLLYSFKINFVFKWKILIYVVGLIVAVDDLKKFHHQNIMMNKSHYPITGRLLKEKFIAYFSKYGARIHFNTFKLENQKTMKYGVIRKIDLIQDLNLWETLCASSFLMRPVNILQTDRDIEVAQKNNLRSAWAFSGLMTKNGWSEVEFYK